MNSASLLNNNRLKVQNQNQNQIKINNNVNKELLGNRQNVYL